jgi:hypothetical protein
MISRTKIYIYINMESFKGAGIMQQVTDLHQISMSNMSLIGMVLRHRCNFTLLQFTDRYSTMNIST